MYALPDSNDPTDSTGHESGLESGVVDRRVDRRFVEVLEDFEPDVVHFQHFKRLSSTLPARCRERGVTCIATLHDFWTICHREQLVQPFGTLCFGPESVEKCADCYDDARKLSVGTDGRTRDSNDESSDDEPSNEPVDVGTPIDARTAVGRRTESLETALERLDLLVAPSRFLRGRVVAFASPSTPIVHCRNGIRVDAFRDTGYDPDGPFRVGYAGRITARKGVHVLLSAVRDLDGDVRLDVFGRFDPEETPYHARLLERAGNRVTFHGRYEDAATPYETMDVLVVPSLWYENSPLVIQEAFASSVPVVAGDIGGMAELVTSGVDGVLFPWGDADALRAALQRLVDAPAKVRRLRAGIDPPKSLSDHVDELLAIYETCLDGRVPPVDEPA